MRVVQVPFFLGGNELIADRDKLRSLIGRQLGAATNAHFHVCVELAFGALPKDVFSTRDIDALKRVLGGNDRIVFVRVPRRIVAFAVRTSGADSRISGLRTGISPVSLATVAHASEGDNKQTMARRAAAKNVAERFLKAAQQKNIEGMMKLADVPWYDDGTSMVDDNRTLKKLLRSAWIDNTRSSAPDITGLMRFRNLGEPYGGSRLPAEKVLTQDDWIVLFGNGQRSRGMLLVRVQGEVARVVGATAQ